MIRVKKIAHASYDVPDVEQQADYYTNILGMTVAAKEKDAVFLANTVDHHSVVLRKGAQAQCVRVGVPARRARRSRRVREAGPGPRHQDRSARRTRSRRSRTCSPSRIRRAR